MRIRFGVIAVVLAFVWITPSLANGQELITAYSIHKHRGEDRVFCINFRQDARSTGPCYFRYGALYVGSELDWLESSAVAGNRSVIKDLGPKAWSDQFTVPVVEPLRELQPGERRVISVDSSGADGADGMPGDRGRRGENSDRSVPSNATRNTMPQMPAKPKHDGKPRVDPMFVRAVVGHMYVVHVVTKTDDFYVLFRVEKIERGSSCTISWMQVPAPSAQVVRN